MLRSGLLVALFLFLRPLYLSAQSTVGSIQLNPVLSREVPSWERRRSSLWPRRSEREPASENPFFWSVAL